MFKKMFALSDVIQSDENNLLLVSCSLDMGWQKRGRGHNSNTGHAAVMKSYIWTTQHV